MLDLRSQLVALTLQWERRFGVAPQVTSALSEYDAASLVGMTEDEYSEAMQGATSVRKGLDFAHKGVRYQIKGTRPSGKPRSKITKVPQANNFDWDVLIWIRYDSQYAIEEAWAWDVNEYRKRFEYATRVSPEDMRLGRALRRNEV